jgi:hypothetical protein
MEEGSGKPLEAYNEVMPSLGKSGLRERTCSLSNPLPLHGLKPSLRPARTPRRAGCGGSEHFVPAVEPGSSVRSYRGPGGDLRGAVAFVAAYGKGVRAALKWPIVTPDDPG